MRLLTLAFGAVALAAAVLGGMVLAPGRSPSGSRAQTALIPAADTATRAGYAYPASPGVTSTGVIAVLDIAYSSYFSSNLINRSVPDAARWLVDQHLCKAAALGVDLVIIKHPYRWRSLEGYQFGGNIVERQLELHNAIVAAKLANRRLPRLCVYQSLPGGKKLSPDDAETLDHQAFVFDEDSWDESIGCDPWQQDLIDARALTRPQHLEPIWDRAFADQWRYPVDVTELFLADGISQYQVIPVPFPGIRVSFHRPIVPRPGESARTAYIRTAQEFHRWCYTVSYTPVFPLDLFTLHNVAATEILAGP